VRIVSRGPWKKPADLAKTLEAFKAAGIEVDRVVVERDRLVVWARRDGETAVSDLDRELEVFEKQHGEG